jgi:hypothetical protein
VERIDIWVDPDKSTDAFYLVRQDQFIAKYPSLVAYPAKLNPLKFDMSGRNPVLK